MNSARRDSKIEVVPLLVRKANRCGTRFIAIVTPDDAFELRDAERIVGCSAWSTASGTFFAKIEVIGTEATDPPIEMYEGRPQEPAHRSEGLMVRRQTVGIGKGFGSFVQ